MLGMRIKFMVTSEHVASDVDIDIDLSSSSYAFHTNILMLV